MIGFNAELQYAINVAMYDARLNHDGNCHWMEKERKNVKLWWEYFLFVFTVEIHLHHLTLYSVENTRCTWSSCEDDHHSWRRFMSHHHWSHLNATNLTNFVSGDIFSIESTSLDKLTRLRSLHCLLAVHLDWLAIIKILVPVDMNWSSTRPSGVSLSWRNCKYFPLTQAFVPVV